VDINPGFGFAFHRAVPQEYFRHTPEVTAPLLSSKFFNKTFVSAHLYYVRYMPALAARIIFCIPAIKIFAAIVCRYIFAHGNNK
jgi:hypothetical protein